MSALGIGFSRDTTRIDDADVSRFFFFGRQTTACRESVAQRGSFGIVEFATQRHESRLFVGDDGGRMRSRSRMLLLCCWGFCGFSIVLVMSSQVVCIHIQLQNYGYLVGMPNFERVSCDFFAAASQLSRAFPSIIPPLRHQRATIALLPIPIGSTIERHCAPKVTEFLPPLDTDSSAS